MFDVEDKRRGASEYVFFYLLPLSFPSLCSQEERARKMKFLGRQKQKAKMTQQQTTTKNKNCD
jgi:hypothetical protein